MARTFGIESLLRAGELQIVLPNQKALTLKGMEAGPAARLTLNRWRGLRRFFGGGTVGFGEAFMDGDWDSPDLPKVIELAARNLPRRPMAFRSLSPWRLGDRIRHVVRPNTRKGSSNNIAAHYDLGNDFYALWLDNSMTYSSAIFANGEVDLKRAQEEKNRRLMNIIGVKSGDSVLEIGCGWGGFALQVAKERGAQVTGITVSRAQFDEARRRVQRAGLAEQVDIRLCDYRDLEGVWDHAVSIEMIEAVGERYWDIYFKCVAESVKYGGAFALQAIVIENDRFEAYRRSADFIQKHIFPGGALLSPSELYIRANTAGFTRKTSANYGLDYAETLVHWRTRFQAAGDRVAALGFDERFRRCWLFYLAYCEGGFRAGNIDAMQMAFVRS